MSLQDIEIDRYAITSLFSGMFMNTIKLSFELFNVFNPKQTPAQT